VASDGPQKKLPGRISKAAIHESDLVIVSNMEYPGGLLD